VEHWVPVDTPTDQRAAVHHAAEAAGLLTVSYGLDDARSLQLLKPPGERQAVARKAGFGSVVGEGTDGISLWKLAMYGHRDGCDDITRQEASQLKETVLHPVTHACERFYKDIVEELALRLEQDCGDLFTKDGLSIECLKCDEIVLCCASVTEVCGVDGVIRRLQAAVRSMFRQEFQDEVMPLLHFDAILPLEIPAARWSSSPLPVEVRFMRRWEGFHVLKGMEMDLKGLPWDISEQAYSDLEAAFQAVVQETERRNLLAEWLLVPPSSE